MIAIQKLILSNLENNITEFGKMHEDEPSLLSHLELVRSQALPEGGLSTMIYCGRINQEETLTKILQTHREKVEDEVNKEGANISGILMGQGNSVLHLLEGPSFSILRILNNLAGHEDFLTGLQFGRIVYTVEDRPQRFFPEWYSCTIQERKSPEQDITDENCKDIVFEMAEQLLGVGTGLSAESQEALDLSKYAHKLPGKNSILSLSEAQQFFTLQDFIEFYYDPYHIDLESERSWPLERLVKY